MIRRSSRPATVLAAALLASACAGTPRPGTPAPLAGEPAAAAAPIRTSDGGVIVVDQAGRDWADATLERLSLEQRIAQMIVPWTDGSFLGQGTPQYERLRHWVEDVGVGGIIVSIGAPGDMALKLNALQALADVPLLIGTDMEHGPGQRLESGTVLPYGMELGGGTAFPATMALGATRDPELARAMGRVTAAEARAVGIHWDFAPVVDVNSNPANPIINTRSYGEEPGLVSRMATAQLEGLQQGGMIATAKHFPGHGDVSVDSHIDLPVLDASPERLRTLELVPFRAAIDAGIASVMTAHIAFPRLTHDSVPATLNRRILTGLLQDELGFHGLVVTDALGMGALVRNYGPAGIVERAIDAGADVLLMPVDADLVVDSIAAAVRAGRIPRERIDRSVRKILIAKAAVGVDRQRYVDPNALGAVVGTGAHREVAAEIARRSIVVPRDRDGLLPLRPGQDVALVTYAADVEPFAGRAFQRALGIAAPRAVRLSMDPDSTELAAADSAIAGADVVVFALYVRPVERKGNVLTTPGVAAMVRRAAGAGPAVVVSFGSPYLLSDFPGVGTYVLAWGNEDVSQEAAAAALLGTAPVTGRLPVSIPPLHAFGDGIDYGTDESGARGSATAPVGLATSPVAPLASVAPADAGMSAAALARVDARVERAIAEKVTPGAALAVGRAGKLVRDRGYGRLDWADGSAPVTDSTIYDMASLSKAVGTTTVAMLMVDDGRIELDSPVSRYLPELKDAPVGGSTLRQLLTHSAGLPAYRPFWLTRVGEPAYVRAIGAEELAYEPGTQRVYSDLGMILMGAVLHRVTGERQDSLLQRRVFGPLGMRDTGYLPLGGPPGPRGGGWTTADRIAPTELDPNWRHRHLRGQVHDENAYAIGGVAGHAGLFSSARDLARFAQMLLNGGELDGVRVVSQKTVTRFLAPDSTLGWYNVRISESVGSKFGPRSFGHTGFTGTSLFVDPDQRLFVVLLTNRVDPTRERGGHVELRKDVHDGVETAITGAPK